MGPQISLFICAGVALLTLAFAIFNSIQRAQERREDSFDGAIARLNEMIAVMPILHQLGTKERKAESRRIVRLIREDCGLLSDALRHVCLEPKTEEAKRLALTALLQTYHVYRMTNMILLLLLFRPALLRNCQRVSEMARQHSQMWFAYLRALRAQYPDELRELPIPD